MRKIKLGAVLAVFAIGMLSSTPLQAYPPPGPGQEVYVTYYSNSARTNVVGVRGISHDSSCSTWHITWGVTTAYSTVAVTNCPNNNEPW
jgi:hypothetical protein